MITSGPRLVLLLVLAAPAAARAATARTATVADLVAAMTAVAAEEESAPSVRADFDALVAAHGLAGDERQWHDYVRLRLVFEATRDGGLWGLRWTITDRPPDSSAVWAAWARLGPALGVDAGGYLARHPSADAECDELSALCAFLARKLGVAGVGLFWPSANHTVAVWTTRGKDGAPRRVVLPTSQVFLGRDDTFGTQAFDPSTQKRIYDYGHADVGDDFALPRPLVDAFVAALRARGAQSARALQDARNARVATMGGS